MITEDARYPLTWPDGWKRTPDSARVWLSPFKTTPEKANREMLQELDRLGARRVIVSSNLKLRLDGSPYANQRRHPDEGIAVYFRRAGVDMVLACDKFTKREDNMRAITKTIEAIRGIERWGSSALMERAFTGFAQLANESAERKWWDVLGVPSDAPGPQIEEAYRRRLSATHPDKGGDPVEFRAVKAAWAKYCAENAP
jgi:hypothetical protein